MIKRMTCGWCGLEVAFKPAGNRPANHLHPATRRLCTGSNMLVSEHRQVRLAMSEGSQFEPLMGNQRRKLK